MAHGKMDPAEIPAEFRRTFTLGPGLLALEPTRLAFFLEQRSRVEVYYGNTRDIFELRAHDAAALDSASATLQLMDRMLERCIDLRARPTATAEDIKMLASCDQFDRSWELGLLFWSDVNTRSRLGTLVIVVTLLVLACCLRALVALTCRMRRAAGRRLPIARAPRAIAEACSRFLFAVSGLLLPPDDADGAVAPNAPSIRPTGRAHCRPKQVLKASSSPRTSTKGTGTTRNSAARCARTLVRSTRAPSCWPKAMS